jgi:hypothetical protein
MEDMTEDMAEETGATSEAAELMAYEEGAAA